MLRHIEGLFVDLYLHAMVNDLLKRARALSSGALRSEQRSPGENPPSASVGRSMQPGRVDARVSDDEDGGGGPQPQLGDQQWPTREAGSAGGPAATVGKSRQQKHAKRAEMGHGLRRPRASWRRPGQLREHNGRRRSLTAE